MAGSSGRVLQTACPEESSNALAGNPFDSATRVLMTIRTPDKRMKIFSLPNCPESQRQHNSAAGNGACQQPGRSRSGWPASLIDACLAVAVEGHAEPAQRIQGLRNQGQGSR